MIIKIFDTQTIYKTKYKGEKEHVRETDRNHRGTAERRRYGSDRRQQFKEDLKADSLDLFELVMALEEEFGIEIPSEKLESFTTVGSVVDYMKENGIEI